MNILDDNLDAMPRRAIADMALWELRLKNITKRWAGWSVRENKGRVLVAHRPNADMSEQVLLPVELRWAEQCEDDITEWVKRIYKHWDGGEKSLKVALEEPSLRATSSAIPTPSPGETSVRAIASAAWITVARSPSRPGKRIICRPSMRR